jgi:hypothetical protein
MLCFSYSHFTPTSPLIKKSEAAPDIWKVPCCVWTPDTHKLHKLNLCNHMDQPTGIKKSNRHKTTINECCGSESERIRKFWLDPNPTKKVRIRIRIQTLL